MPILTYQLLQPGHKDFPQAEMLYTEAFPSCERRDLGKWRMLAANALAPFTVWGLYAEEEFVGFITFWQFDGFIYVEHFAILATQRDDLEIHSAVCLSVELFDKENRTDLYFVLLAAGFNYCIHA